MGSGHRALLVMVISLISMEVAAACQIPLERTRSAFVTAAWIDGRGPFRLLVDSGTSVTIVSPAVARAAGLSEGKAVGAASTTGPVVVRETAIGTLRAGDFERLDVQAFILDLPRFRNHGAIDGILGANFLDGTSYLFDVRKGCLHVGVAVEGGERFDAAVIAGRVALEIDDMKVTLDPAATMTVLISPRARALAVRGDPTVIESAAGRRQVYSATIPLLQLGEMVLKNLPAVLVPDETGEDALLPISMFDTVFVAAGRQSVVLNGRPAASQSQQAAQRRRQGERTAGHRSGRERSGSRSAE